MYLLRVCVRTERVGNFVGRTRATNNPTEICFLEEPRSCYALWRTASRRLPRRPPAVHDEVMPCAVCGGIRGQVDERTPHLVSVSHPAHRTQAGVAAGERVRVLIVHPAGSDAIDSNSRSTP